MSRDAAWELLARGSEEGPCRLWLTGRGYKTTEPAIDLRDSGDSAVLVAEIGGAEDDEGMNVRDILDTLAAAETRFDRLVAAVQG